MTTKDTSFSGRADRAMELLAGFHAEMGKNCRAHPKGQSRCETCWLRKEVKYRLGRIMWTLRGPKENNTLERSDTLRGVN